MRIAVIGGGVAGIVSAHILQREHDVVLFEANDYLGGHTSTVVLEDGPDVGMAIDTGFIVLNDKTYPLFHRFLKQLGVAVRWSDMSFGYHSQRTGFQYAGTTLNGMFAQRRNLLSPRFWRFLLELRRFCVCAQHRLRTQGLQGLSLEEFLREERFSSVMVEDYLIPMGGAIWSASRGEIMKFPASTFVNFFNNHGLLSVKDRPRWQTVVGGSHSYVKEFIKSFRGEIRLQTPCKKVMRTNDGITVMTEDCEEHFDKVVLAAHADQTMSMLGDASDDETKIFGAWHYSRNHTVLHTDRNVLPPNRRAWASWNYFRQADLAEQDPVSVTYHMNRLQGLETANEYCVTLNRKAGIDPTKVIREFWYEHPIYDLAAIESQQHIPSINGKRNTYFCGSYCGYGFHEDAVRAAVDVGKLLGLEL